MLPKSCSSKKEAGKALLSPAATEFRKPSMREAESGEAVLGIIVSELSKLLVRLPEKSSFPEMRDGEALLPPVFDPSEPPKKPPRSLCVIEEAEIGKAVLLPVFELSDPRKCPPRKLLSCERAVGGALLSSEPSKRLPGTSSFPEVEVGGTP